LANNFNYKNAFSRNLGWVTEEEQSSLQNKRIAIAGMGGVGGTHLLTLTRLGIGRFNISDTGYGIPEERQHEIFMPFHRLSDDADKTEGTGIGLIIVRELVQLMNGDIGFSSTPGYGTTFWFQLPIAVDEV